MKYINKDRTMLFLDSMGLSLCAFLREEGPKGTLDFGPKKDQKGQVIKRIVYKIRIKLKKITSRRYRAGPIGNTKNIKNRYKKNMIFIIILRVQR